MQDVSRFLGHSSVTITEKYYAPFVTSRKDALMAKRIALAAPAMTPASARVVSIRKRRAS